MQWAPLPGDAFHTVHAQKLYINARKWYSENVLLEVIQRCSPSLRAVVAKCDQLGCQPGTCRLNRGLLLVNAKTLTPSSVEDDVDVEWKSLGEVCSLKRHSLVQACCQYDRYQALLFAVHFRKELLHDVLFESRVPADGVIGFGMVDTCKLARSYARYCMKHGLDPLDTSLMLIPIRRFADHGTLPVPRYRQQLAAEPSAAVLPDGGTPEQGIGDVASNEPAEPPSAARSGGPVEEPTHPSVAAEPLQGNSSMHSLGNVIASEACSAVWPSPGAAKVASCNPGSNGAPAAEAAPISSMATGDPAKPGTATHSDSATLQPDMHLTLQQQQYWLQVTVNHAWQSVCRAADSLSSTALKVHCKGGCAKDCDVCRGCLLMNVCQLARDSSPFKYVYKGQPQCCSKQLRLEWCTAFDLHALGCQNTDLIMAIAGYDRRTSYPVAIRVPTSLIWPIMEGLPGQGGVVYWHIMRHAEAAVAPEPQINPPVVTLESFHSNRGFSRCPAVSPSLLRSSCNAVTRPLTPRSPSTQRDIGDRSIKANISARLNVSAAADAAVAAVDAETAAALTAVQPEHGHVERAQVPGSATGTTPCNDDQQQPQSDLLHHKCALPACTMPCGPNMGMRLLVCTACRSTAYCTPEHQRAHWKDHKQACLAAAAAALAAAAAAAAAGTDGTALISLHS